MKDRSVSSRYAKVLFAIDQKEERLQKRLVDFSTIIQIFKKNLKLIKFLQSPHIAMEEKTKLLQTCLQEAFGPLFLNFLFFLVQKGRISNLVHIANEYRLMVNKYHGIWEADVMTAVALDPDSEGKLKHWLEKDFDKKINLNKTVDSELIGGAILVFDNEMLDWSVSSRLKKLKDNLIAAQV